MVQKKESKKVKEVKKEIPKTGLKKTVKNVVVNYPVGDFLIRIKNAALAGRYEIVIKRTRLVEDVAKVLKSEGFVTSIENKDDELTITLSKFSKSPMLLGLKLISRPGLRKYYNVDRLMKLRGPEVYILSTPKGVMSSREAKKKVVGGEVIAKIW